mgnify:CR=1 FL=1
MMYETIPTVRPSTPLLDRIDQPCQLKSLCLTELKQLADELRLYLLYAAGQSGGHFGANLGVVELTIALHHALDTPKDRLVWDVGHQAYAHKVLTGRRDALTTIRSKNGLAAFPTREESEFDTFGVGHSSTAISAALGMALALRYQADNRRVACVIGDGAMTAGMAFEAMNDAVQHNADLLVVLNDNDMSISGSVGGFAKHLGALWKQGQSVHLADNGEVSIQPHPNWTFNPRVNSNDAAENLFRAIGFEYFGPVDGHNLPELTRILTLLKDRKGPRLLHVYTTKGKGFAPAELDPIGYHAIARITPQLNSNASLTDKTNTDIDTPKPQKYSDVFGQFLCDQAALDDRLLAITPAMCEGSGMVQFSKQYANRFFDVAIAEQHAITLAAGMACEGLKPVVAIYSTFLQRGYDQLIHDVALQNLDVTFGIDRAGVVGEDGPTHAGAYDYAYLRTVPHLIVMAPKDENECRQMLHTAYQYPGPAAVRYPRGTGPGSVIEQKFTAIEMGKAEILAHVHDYAPKQIALLAFGSMVPKALEAAQQLASDQVGVMVVNMRFVKPLDHRLLKQLAPAVCAFVTLEEHAIMGGAGSAVNESLQAQNLLKPVLNIGLPDRFLAQATHAQMLHDIGLDAQGIARQVKGFLSHLAD